MNVERYLQERLEQRLDESFADSCAVSEQLMEAGVDLFEAEPETLH